MIRGALLSVLVVCSTFAYRCDYDKNLNGSLSVEFDIVPPTDSNGDELWVSRITVFLFGTIEKKNNARIHAGFYDPATGFLVYKVIIDCRGAGTWKTMFDTNNSGQRAKETPKKSEYGTLDGGCPTGDFDLLAVVGCPERFYWEMEEVEWNCAKQTYFVFNGQVLIKREVVDPEGIYENKPVDIPTDMTPAKLFKAYVKQSEKVTFSHAEYGKCFAFPQKYYGNCSAANLWVLSKSNSLGKDYLGAYGAWPMLYNVNCQSSDPEETLFSAIQDRIIPSGAAFQGLQGTSINTCCCADSLGYLDDSTCIVAYDCSSTIVCA